MLIVPEPMLNGDWFCIMPFTSPMIEQEEQRAEHRGRQADQDDEGIAEAFELRRQHQIDQISSEKAKVMASVLPSVYELPAFTLEVIGHALREISPAFCCRKATASPTVRPGNGTPWKVAELSCWKVARLLGCTVWSS